MKLTYQVEEFKERLEKALESYEEQREKNIEAERQEREKRDKKFGEDKVKVEKAIQELEEEYKQKVADRPDVYTQTFWGKKLLQPKEDIKIEVEDLLWQIKKKSEVMTVIVSNMYFYDDIYAYRPLFKSFSVPDTEVYCKRDAHSRSINEVLFGIINTGISSYKYYTIEISTIKDKLFVLKGAQQTVELEDKDPVLVYLRSVEEK